MTGLQGRRVLVTRTRQQASGLVDLLHQRGADAVVVPLIATHPLAPPEAVSAAAAELRAAPPPRWVAFTSATAVRLVLGVLGTGGLRDVGVAGVGGETAAALTAHGAAVDAVATQPDAAGLAAALVARGVAGATVWFPCAEGAGPALADGLRAAGATVRVQPVYRTEMPADAPRRLRAALERGVDAVTLTSGSTARNLIAALGGRRLEARVAVVCVGPRTAGDARDAGLEVAAVAAQPSAAGIVDALERALAGGAAGDQGGAGRLVG